MSEEKNWKVRYWSQETVSTGLWVETVLVTERVAKILEKEMERGEAFKAVTKSEFEKASEPLMKWMKENHHPMVTAIITQSTAELLEGMEGLDLTREGMGYERE